MTSTSTDAAFYRDLRREPSLRLEVVGVSVPSAGPSRSFVGLAMLVPRAFAPRFFLPRIHAALNVPQVEAEVKVDPRTPALDETLQHWSMRLAVHSARAAHAYGRHTGQVELWGRAPGEPARAALCQVMTKDAAVLDDVVHRLAGLRSLPDPQTHAHDVRYRKLTPVPEDFEFQRLMSAVTGAADQRRA